MGLEKTVDDGRCTFRGQVERQAGPSEPFTDFLEHLFKPVALESAVIDRAAPRKEPARRGMLGYGDFDTTMDVVAKAVAKGPWLMGEQFTAADVVIGANVRWGMMFKMLPERKEFTDYAARIAARPTAQRAEAKDKEWQAA